MISFYYHHFHYSHHSFLINVYKIYIDVNVGISLPPEQQSQSPGHIQRSRRSPPAKPFPVLIKRQPQKILRRTDQHQHRTHRIHRIVQQFPRRELPAHQSAVNRAIGPESHRVVTRIVEIKIRKRKRKTTGSGRSGR